MREKLIIYIHQEDHAHPSWAISADGAIKETTHFGDANLLADLTDEREVIVIVPAEDILLLQTHMPKMSKSKVQQALPYALEEQLVTDIEKLHFALTTLEDGALAVAVVAHEKMATWQALLQSWQIQPDSVISAVHAIPYEEKSWQLLLNDVAIVRMDEQVGFACDQQNLVSMLTLAYQHADQKPSLLQVFNLQKTALPEMKAVAAVVEQTSSTFAQLWPRLALVAEKNKGINLLQGRYATKKSKFPERKKLLQWTIVLASVFAGMIFAYPLVSYFILKNRLVSIDNEIAAIYKTNFPQATNVVAPKIRMQEKLQKLNSQMGDNRFLLLLGYVGKTLTTSEGITLKRFDFQNNQLNLELTAANSENLNTFSSALSKQGLLVKQQNANLSGSQMNATLLIE